LVFDFDLLNDWTGPIVDIWAGDGHSTRPSIDHFVGRGLAFVSHLVVSPRIGSYQDISGD